MTKFQCQQNQPNNLEKKIANQTWNKEQKINTYVCVSCQQGKRCWHAKQNKKCLISTYLFIQVK